MNPPVTNQTEPPPPCPPHDFELDRTAPILQDLYTHENVNDMRSESEFIASTCRKCGARVYQMQKR